jgi:prepilin-type N-terminal cleavage/methylation domain-containing protein
MFKNIRNRMDWSDKSSSQKGFTLIELLVVIAILGVLAVVGVLSFGGLTDSAKKSTAKTELTQIQAAVDAYNAKHLAYPTAGDPLDLTILTGDGELKASAATGSQCNYKLTAAGDVSFATSQTGKDPVNCV